MNSSGAAKHFILAFLLALVGYATFYQLIEWRRARNGPWQVKFKTEVGGAPVIFIDQPRLHITNVQIRFAGVILRDTNAAGAFALKNPRPDSLSTDPQIPAAGISFAQPRPVPFDVPFGQCVFMDTTFLPGTLTFRLFGHEIELLPRVLIIDRKEHVWQADSSIALPSARPAPGQAAP